MAAVQKLETLIGAYFWETGENSAFFLASL
jgi:hypothetical protein